ncbi:MAG: GNAT family N-acetyltransferase [Dehalococcoidia bacterium]
MLEGPLPGDTAPFRVAHLTRDAERVAFEVLQALDWAEGGSDSREPDLAAAMAAAMRAKAPPIRCWLGYVGGVARGYVWSWPGLDGVGQVESLFVHPEFRHRGLATALLHPPVRDCRDLGAGPVIIVADAAGTPRDMYAAMGWRAVAMRRSYLRMRESRTTAVAVSGEPR